MIFGIDFDPASNRLASVSDDRTVAVWRGDPLPSPEVGWAGFHLLARFFAHEARVWSAVLLPWGLVSVGEVRCRFFVFFRKKLSLILLLSMLSVTLVRFLEFSASVLQDCHLTFWAESVEENEKEFRKVLDVVPHKGRGIWSLAVNPEQRVIVSCFLSCFAFAKVFLNISFDENI